MVADGMGSFSGGGLAAEIAVTLVPSLMARLSPGGPLAHLMAGGSTCADRLAMAIRRASECIARAADLDDLFRGMGSTIAACVLSEGRLAIAHVGHSRIYLFRNGTLTRLTIDHCLALDTESSARASVVTRALGTSGNDLLADTRSVDVHPGDRLLLATDGLHRLVSEAEMLRALDQLFDDPQHAADQLLAMARHRRGNDDATCVVAHLH